MAEKISDKLDVEIEIKRSRTIKADGGNLKLSFNEDDEFWRLKKANSTSRFTKAEMNVLVKMFMAIMEEVEK